MWEVGDRLTHRHNPELGQGRVVAVDGRAVVVEFSEGTTLRLASGGEALVRLAENDPGPSDARADLADRLAAGDIDPVEDLALRLEDEGYAPILAEAGFEGALEEDPEVEHLEELQD